MTESALFRIVVEVLSANKQNDSYEKYMVPGIGDELQCVDLTKSDLPSRTITFNSFMQLPIVKALYRVRQNMLLSKTSTPIHGNEATVPSDH